LAQGKQEFAGFSRPVSGQRKAELQRQNGWQRRAQQRQVMRQNSAYNRSMRDSACSQR
jgi:hypothetical protein